MKITFVLDDSLDPSDGVQQYVLTLGHWLASQAHEVSYIVGPTNRTDISNVHGMGRLFATRFNGNAVRTPLPVGKAQIAKLIDQLAPDVLHVQMPYSPFFAGRVIQSTRRTTAVVGTFHVLANDAPAMIGNRLLRVALFASLRRISIVAAVSASASEFATRAYGLSPRIIGNAVDVRRLARHAAPSRRQGETTIAYLGRLVERKGVLQLIAAYNALPDRAAAGTRLIIAGKGPLLAKARQAVVAGRNVQFRGFIPEQAKAQFLADADIAIFPSLSGESFGIVLIEAIAAGAGVVLAGDNPGYGDVLREYPEALIDMSHPIAASATLERYIRDPSLRERLHEGQQKLAHAYDVAVIGPQVMAMYEQALVKVRS